MKSKIGLQLPDPDPQDPFRQSWEGAEKVDSETCAHCRGLKRQRNPTGECDHLYWPDNLTDEAKRANGYEPKTVTIWETLDDENQAVTVWRPGAVQQISRPPVTVNDKIFWTLDMSAAEPADLTIEELDKAIRSLFILEESAKPPK